MYSWENSRCKSYGENLQNYKKTAIMRNSDTADKPRYTVGDSKNMEQSDNLLGRIQKQNHTFSKGQKRLASYIVNNYDKAVFLTAARLGKEVGVSESTTVRFATQLGYKGFPEFHRALEG